MQWKVGDRLRCVKVPPFSNMWDVGMEGIVEEDTRSDVPQNLERSSIRLRPIYENGVHSQQAYCLFPEDEPYFTPILSEEDELNRFLIEESKRLRRIQ